MAWLVVIAVVGTAAVTLATYTVMSRPTFADPWSVPTSPAGVRSRFRRTRDALVAEWTRFGAYVIVVAAGIGGLIPGLWGIGRLAEHGKLIDRPVFHWVSSHQGHRLTQFMKVYTLYANKPQVWYAAVALGALVSLGAVVRRRPTPLVPAVELLLMALTVHYVNLWVGHIIQRPPVPVHGGGAFPSGGCARAVAVYGLGCYLGVRAWGIGPRLRAVAYGLVAGLAFLEGFSRVYLSKHWLLDAAGGVVEGLALLAIFIAASTALIRRTPDALPQPATHDRVTAG